ncbi:MAG: AsnC family transcriptional regulator [Methanobacteriota archaeon]|nr:MAG: AsnC family transcriptional regulator [Euryarchaeota archaeon]
MLDEKDEKLIKLLVEDGRASLKELAKELSMSSTAVKKRMEKLMKSGVLLGFSAKVNYKTLGESRTLLIAHVKPEQYVEFLKVMSRLNIEAAYENRTGGHHIVYMFVDKLNKEGLDKLAKYSKICPSARVEKIV